MPTAIPHPAIPALIAGLGLALAACAPTSGGSAGAADMAAATDTETARACFYPNQVRNFRSERGDKLYVRSARNEVFELSAVGFCPDLPSAIALTLNPRFGGSTRLCPSDQATVVIGQPSPTSSAPCHVRVERRLTEDEIAALPERARP